MTFIRFSSRINASMLLFGLTFIFLSGCTSLPGDGGTSEITGKVYVNEYNVSGILFNSYYGADIRVYIIYGDETTYDDEIRTSYDGSYKFTFLRQGNYKVFAYSDCVACDGGIEAVIQEVEINENHTTVTVPDIRIDKR